MDTKIVLGNLRKPGARGVSTDIWRLVSLAWSLRRIDRAAHRSVSSVHERWRLLFFEPNGYTLESTLYVNILKTHHLLNHIVSVLSSICLPARFARIHKVSLLRKDRAGLLRHFTYISKAPTTINYVVRPSPELELAYGWSTHLK